MVICIISNICLFFSCTISLIYINKSLSNLSELMLGIASMFSVVNLGRYLEYTKDYSSIYNTFNLSFVSIYKYLVGVSPIFIGFLLLGLCLFWKSNYFSTPFNALMTLFSLSQGDSTLDIFKDVGSIQSMLGYLYVGLFCLFFFVVVMNIFIAIIEDAFTVDKMNNKSHWMFDYINLVKPNNIKKIITVEDIKQNKIKYFKRKEMVIIIV